MDKFGVSSRRPIFRTRNTPNPNGSGIAQSWRGLVCLGLCLGQMLHRRRMPALCQGYQLSGKAWACGALEELIWMSNSASCLTPTLFVCLFCLSDLDGPHWWQPARGQGQSRLGTCLYPRTPSQATMLSSSRQLTNNLSSSSRQLP